MARGTNSGASYDASSDAGERAASQVQGLALVGPPEPNPFQGTTTIHYRTANSAPVHLRVVDVRGRLVRDTVLEPASPGEHSFTWDGTDAGGGRSRPVPTSSNCCQDPRPRGEECSSPANIYSVRGGHRPPPRKDGSACRRDSRFPKFTSER